MSDCDSPRRGSRHYPMVVALILGLVGLGAPWVVVELPTGAVGQAGVTEVAPASFSATLAAVAAWGATLLTRRTATRVISALHVALAVTAAVSMVRALLATDSVVESVASGASGVIGALTAAEATVTWSPGWISLWGLVLFALIASGVWGIVAPGSRRQRRSKYERADHAEELDPWESLSDGNDPTSR